MSLERKAKAVLSSVRNNDGEPSVATGGKTFGWSIPHCFQEYFLRWSNQKGAENICVQLGYVSGTWYRAPGCSGPIQAGNRQCSGGEETVWDCPLMGGNTDNTGGCSSHNHDVGVQCTGSGKPRCCVKNIIFGIICLN